VTNVCFGRIDPFTDTTFQPFSLPRGLPVFSIPQIPFAGLVPVVIGGGTAALISFADTSVLSRRPRSSEELLRCVRAAIINPVRTPVGAFGGALRPVPVEALGGIVAEETLKRSGLDPSQA
jgi:hypothetical protein